MGDSPYKPKGLGAHADQFWDDVTSTYALRFDDLEVLRAAAQEIDLIEDIQRALSLRDKTMVSTGSMGQEVADPLIQELRQHRGMLRQLLGQLKLPDVSGAGTKPKGESRAEVSEKARAAARARWDAVTG